MSKEIDILLIGSHNQAKVEEWGKLLSVEVSVKSAAELEIPEVEESGLTFIENARIKAKHYATKANTYAFAEDGGFEIDALNGAPGVKSRRILPGDKDGTDQELIDFVLNRLEGKSLEERGVSLTTAVAISDPNGNIIYEDTEKMRGVVSTQPGLVLVPGYPFRTIHYLPELGKTYAELTDEERKAYSHKQKVAKRIIEWLNS